MILVFISKGYFISYNKEVCELNTQHEVHYSLFCNIYAVHVPFDTRNNVNANDLYHYELTPTHLL